MQQCESAHSSDGPLPAAIEDSVAAAIEDGATMDGLICLQREADRCVEEWERTREPGAEGLSALIAIETLRTLALRTMAELGAREEPVATEDLGRLALALYRIESADKLRIEREQAAADAAAAHDGAAARAASMTHAERVETVRRAMEGHLFPGGTDPPPAASGWARRLCRGLSRHPAGAGDRSACRRPSRAFTGHPAGAGARFACRRRGAGRWRCAGCMRRARFMGCAQSARYRAETAGGGRPTLADRPSLLPRGVERTGVRRGIPYPPQPDTRCRRHDHAMWSDRKDTPTSPRPSPPPRGGEGE